MAAAAAGTAETTVTPTPAVLVVGLVGLIAEGAPMPVAPRLRWAPAAGTPTEGTRPRTERTRPERPSRPPPAERAEGGLDRGDGISAGIVGT
jgi:hypothetical protein